MNMDLRSLLSSGIIAWLPLLLLICNGCLAKRKWDYEPLSIDVFSSDEAKAKIEARVEPMGREYALTASLVFDYDMDETTMIEIVAYRSSSGNEDDYKVLPWSVPLQTFKQFSNDFYKDMAYKNLKDCSNLPPPEAVYPFPKNTYNFNQCVVTGDGMPEVLPLGYYKVVLTVSGGLECGFIAIVKLTSQTDLTG